MRRFAVLAVLALLAGCGGEAGVQTGVGASLAPKDAVALVEIDGDLDSGQWEAAKALLARFPDGDKLLGKLADQDLDLEDDLDPAFGDRVVAVVLEGEKFVALTQPDDEAKLKELVARDDELETRVVRGWTAIGKPDDLTAYEQALTQGTIEGDAAYEAAQAKLPEDALATAFVSGAALGEKLAGARFDWMSLALTAEERGVRVAGTVHSDDAPDIESVSDDLLEQVPGDALGVLAFGSGAFSEQLASPALGGLQEMLGLDFQPIADLLDGGGVLWVRPGLPIPEVTVLLEDGDAAAIEKLVRQFAADVPIQDVDFDGRPAKRVSVGPVGITWAEVDDRLVVTTAASLRPSDENLQDDASFQEAREAAGMPDETDGFLYVNLQQVVPLVESLFGLSGEGLDPEISRNLRPLASLLAFGSSEGDEASFSFFLEIR
jgi:hypothetical protein